MASVRWSITLASYKKIAQHKAFQPIRRRYVASFG